MKHVYIQRKGDEILFSEFYKNLKKLDDNALIEDYNHATKVGIVGVHAQALSLLAKRKVFIERFGKSPIKFEDNIIISLTGKISLLNNSYTKLI